MFNLSFLHREHIDLIRRQNRRLSPYEVDKIHSKKFPDWFHERVSVKKHPLSILNFIII